MTDRFRPGDIVQHFKREMLSDEERAGIMRPVLPADGFRVYNNCLENKITSQEDI